MDELKKRRAARIAALAGCAGVLALTGCGGSSNGTTIQNRTPSGAVSANASGDARYTEEQVAKMTHLHSDHSGGWISPHNCYLDILTTHAAVELYAEAGDPVVSNPAGDVGFKFSPDPGCRAELLRLLERVR